MNTSEQKSILQYSTIVIIFICFIIAFIYQNIEYMQLKMHYNAMIKEYHTVIEEYEREKYQLNKALSMEQIEIFAKRYGLVPMTKESLVILKGKKGIH
ncbi:MAG: hypothetical protein WBK20_06865 [Spirochaetota bacterium]